MTPSAMRSTLGNGLHLRITLIDNLVEPLQKVNGIEILLATVNIGNPFSLVPRIIQIEHGGYGVDPEPVDVVAVEPEQGTADQERSDLVAAVVEDVAFPFGMEALLGVGMLEQIGPIEVHQTMLVTGKVRGDPVEDDPMP